MPETDPPMTDDTQAAPADTELEKMRAAIEDLERERDEASADAGRQKAGMREVALMRAANAAACLGHYARPLLRLALAAESQRAALDVENARLREGLEEIYRDVGVGGLGPALAAKALKRGVWAE